MYLIAVDVGTSLMKAAVLEKDAIGRQWVATERVVQTAVAEQSLASLIEELMEVVRQLAIANKTGSTDFDLVLVGHPPDLDIYTEAARVMRFSHEEALTAVARRQSANGSVLMVDIGCHRTMVALAKYGKVSAESFDYGVGEQSWSFLRHGDTAEQLRAWLPFEVADGIVSNYIATKSLYPSSIPTSTVELAIEQSLAKLILRQIESKLPIPWLDIDQVMVSGGVLSQPAHDPQTVACVLDGFQPLGSFQLFSDSSLLLFALGGAFEAWSSKDYSVGRTLLRATMQPVARVVCLAERTEAGKAPAKGKATRITLDVGLSSQQALEVKADEVAVVPWSAEEVGEMIVKGGAEHLTKEVQTVVGGSVGLVIDGRARPILLSRQDRERRTQLLNWDKQLNVHQQVGMLEEIIATADEQKAGGGRQGVGMNPGRQVENSEVKRG